MRATQFYVVIDKEKKSGSIMVDRTKAAQLIGCHTHTIKYRLRNVNWYENERYIIYRSGITRSRRSHTGLKAGIPYRLQPITRF